MNWEIYTLSDPRTLRARYVGVTLQGEGRRYRQHMFNARSGRGRSHLYNWLRVLLGIGEKPIYLALEYGNGDGWQERERFWIATHRKFCDLTNLTDGGEGTPGYIPTPEHRAKLSVVGKGRPHSVDHCAKLAAAQTGRVWKEEHCAKLSAIHKANPVTVERCIRLAEARRGKALTPEHRAVLSAVRKGRTHSIETREKISRSLRARNLIVAAALLCVSVLSSGIACAGDLDNARQYWSVVNGNLGRDTIGTTVDTFYSATNQGPILSAVNSCVRKYAAHLGIYTTEKVVLDDRKFYYPVQASFIEDGTTAKPFAVYGITSDGGTLYGLERAKIPTQMGNSSTLGPFPALWDLRDDQLWVNSPLKNDTIFIIGPIEGITMTDGADTTNVLPADRNAVCDCATALVADQIGLTGLSDKYWSRFEAHIIARGGTTPTRGPEVPK